MNDSTQTVRNALATQPRVTLAQLPTPIHDAVRLRQRLCHLLTNAVKFTAEGSIRLGARRTPDDQCVEITVRDTGIGMDAEEMQSILKGIEGTPTDPREYRGLGLGLRMATRMTSFLGGRLSFHSTPGTGTRLTVVLPRRFRDAPANPQLM